jgi:hypothetical protein
VIDAVRTDGGLRVVLDRVRSNFDACTFKASRA